MNFNWDAFLFYLACLISGIALGKAVFKQNLLAILIFIILFLMILFIRIKQQQGVKQHEKNNDNTNTYHVN